jgi:pantothenate kinase type III
MQSSLGNNVEIFLTGGTASLIAPLLPFRVTIVEHLVLDGIAAIGRRLEQLERPRA